MWQEFIVNFSGALGIAALCLLIAGTLFCVIEGIIPGFGFFGISGIAFEVVGVTLYAIQAFNNKTSAMPVFILVLFITLVIVLLFLLVVRSAKYGLLGKSSLVEKESALPIKYGEADAEVYALLIGRKGQLVCECKPVGKLRLKDEIFEIYSNGKFIGAGEEVEIIKVEGIKLIVDRVERSEK